MKTALRWLAASVLVAPAAIAIWFAAGSLWLNHTSKFHSLGVNLRYGFVEIHDPSSDAIVLTFALIALGSGIFVACDHRRKAAAAWNGVVALGIIAVGVGSRW